MALTVAMPDALVIALGAESTALAPEDGATKLTVKPASGLLPESVTFADRATGNAVVTAVVCGDPAATVSTAGTGVVLVSVKTWIKD